MQEIKELESMRAMAQMLYKKADRLIKERQRPVSTESCKNNALLAEVKERRARVKLRRLLKQQSL